MVQVMEDMDQRLAQRVWSRDSGAAHLAPAPAEHRGGGGGDGGGGGSLYLERHPPPREPGGYPPPPGPGAGYGHGGGSGGGGGGGVADFMYLPTSPVHGGLHTPRAREGGW